MKLFYAEEHFSCGNYISDEVASFKHFSVKTGDVIPKVNSAYNYLFFVRKGKVKVACNEYQKEFCEGELFFVPKSAETTGLALAETDIVVHLFDNLVNLCERYHLERLEKYTRGIEYVFKAEKINEPISSFLDNMLFYLEKRMLCKHMLEVKQTELFMLFRGFYTKEACASLFYPIICSNIDFKALVLSNYKKAKTVQDLADACCLSLTTFNRKFKMFFSDSPYHWMLEQRSKHIRAKLRNVKIPICEIVEEFGFSSAGHFTAYCKSHFNMTPTQLRKKILKEN